MARRSRVVRQAGESWRRLFIRDFTLNMIEYYKRKYPDDWPRFLQGIKAKNRGLKDDFGQMYEDNKASDLEARHAMRVPSDFHSVLNNLLIESHEAEFCAPKGELDWFLKTFPIFKVANKL